MPLSKRDVLTAICETPGWAPAGNSSSTIDRYLDELRKEGWIASRLDGYEATPAAVDAYPHFESQPDIAAPMSTTTFAPGKLDGRADQTVPAERVVHLLARLLEQATIDQVQALVRSSRTPIAPHGLRYEASVKLMEEMRDEH